MKKIIYTLLFPIGIVCTAQVKGVGINTDKPQTTLDVNGDTNVSNSIYLNETNISAGNSLQFITSGGENEPASWTDKAMPQGMDLSLNASYMDSFVDKVGVEFNNASAGNTSPYFVNDILNPSVGWKEIPNLQVSFTISKEENRVNLFFQTMIQFTGSSLGSFACGFFVNDNLSNRTQFRLKGVRTDIMLTPSGSYKLFNINTVVRNLPPEDYTMKVACIKRNVSGTNVVAIGKPLTSALNADMSQSTLNISVLEAY